MQIKAGVIDDKGKAKYTRSPRNAAFLCVLVHQSEARRRAGIADEAVQSRLGHASIVLTSDVYGHLFPSTDDGSELAEAEKFLMPV